MAHTLLYFLMEYPPSETEVLVEEHVLVYYI